MQQGRNRERFEILYEATTCNGGCLDLALPALKSDNTLMPR